jgi:hypothetical protein
MLLSSITDGSHAVNKTTEYATCNLVTDNHSLLKYLYSSLVVSTICSVTQKYLILAVGSHLP